MRPRFLNLFDWIKCLAMGLVAVALMYLFSAIAAYLEPLARAIGLVFYWDIRLLIVLLPVAFVSAVVWQLAKQDDMRAQWMSFADTWPVSTTLGDVMVPIIYGYPIYLASGPEPRIYRRMQSYTVGSMLLHSFALMASGIVNMLYGDLDLKTMIMYFAAVSLLATIVQYSMVINFCAPLRIILNLYRPLGESFLYLTIPLVVAIVVLRDWKASIPVYISYFTVVAARGVIATICLHLPWMRGEYRFNPAARFATRFCRYYTFHKKKRLIKAIENCMLFSHGYEARDAIQRVNDKLRGQKCYAFTDTLFWQFTAFTAFIALAGWIILDAISMPFA